ncbi:hypothetical protein C7S17_3011 [Burkholderia thailandensis]|nr:hypothetical protein [Burkholderia thailandensis]
MFALARLLPPSPPPFAAAARQRLPARGRTRFSPRRTANRTRRAPEKRNPAHRSPPVARLPLRAHPAGWACRFGIVAARRWNAPRPTPSARERGRPSPPSVPAPIASLETNDWKARDAPQ